MELLTPLATEPSGSHLSSKGLISFSLFLFFSYPRYRLPATGRSAIFGGDAAGATVVRLGCCGKGSDSRGCGGAAGGAAGAGGRAAGCGGLLLLPQTAVMM